MKQIIMGLKHTIQGYCARCQQQFRLAFEGGDSDVFSPTLLQVQAAPPAPMARAIAITIVVFLCIAVAWSLWAHFDIAVTANGQAIASSKTKVVQALDAGRVVAIHVKDGDVVKQGDALIELDATITDADAEKSQQDRTEAQLDLLRLQAQLQGRTQLQGVPDDVPEDALLRQQQFLQSKVAEQQNKMAVLEQEVIRRRAELESAEANIQKIQQTLPMLQQRLEMREKLLLEGYMSELTVIENRLEVTSQKSELVVQKGKRKEAQQALRSAELSRSQAQAEYRARTAAELAEAQRRWQTGQHEYTKAAYRQAHQVLTSPISGVVQQLAVHTVGGVVNAGQGVMTVVPQEGGIEIEAQVPNKDVGFLREGMPVTIKLDAFEFTKYGALDGVVQWIGADAVKDEKLGNFYPVRVVLKSTQLPITVNGQRPQIRMGMAVTADIGIGQRKAYEYFLGPLLKYQNESLRER
jgi:hemolysin D